MSDSTAPFLVISCSLNPRSRSAHLAKACAEVMSASGQEVEALDLREYPLPLCDGAGAYEAPNVAELSERIGRADGIALALPVYNYGVNAAAKNLLELTGKAWTGKVLGFLCAAGGQASYMSVMAFAGSFMLDYRCVMVPRFVYAPGTAFGGDGITDEAVTGRIEQLGADLVNFTLALKDLTEKAP